MIGHIVQQPHLNGIEADVLVERKEDDLSEAVVVPHSMDKEEFDKKLKLYT